MHTEGISHHWNIITPFQFSGKNSQSENTCERKKSIILKVLLSFEIHEVQVQISSWQEAERGKLFLLPLHGIVTGCVFLTESRNTFGGTVSLELLNGICSYANTSLRIAKV